MLLSLLLPRRAIRSSLETSKVVIKVNGRLFGDVISPVPVGELSIEYRIEDEDEPNAEYATQVFRDAVGGPTAQMVTSVSTEAGGGRYERGHRD